MDLDQCKNLVENICTLFQTRTHTPSSNVASSKSEAVRSGVGSEDVRSEAGEESGGVEEVKGESLSSLDNEVKPRYMYNYDNYYILPLAIN